MKTMKKLLFVLAVLIAIPLVIALFMPQDTHVQREVIIQKPLPEVFDYLRMLKNQDNYGKWNLADPNMKKSYSGVDGQVGFVYAWESEEMGTGEQEITHIEEGKRIESELRFLKPFKMINKCSFETESMGENQTRVIWSFRSHARYPLNIMNVIFDAEKMIGADYEEGLANLKKELE